MEASKHKHVRLQIMEDQKQNLDYLIFYFIKFKIVDCEKVSN